MFYSFSTKLERKITPHTELLLSSLAVKNKKKTFSQVVLIKGLRKQGIYTYVNFSVARLPCNREALPRVFVPGDDDLVGLNSRIVASFQW